MDKDPQASREYLSLENTENPPEGYRLWNDKFLTPLLEEDSHLETLIDGVKRAEARLEGAPDNPELQLVLDAVKDGLELWVKRNGYVTEYPLPDNPHHQP